MIKYCAPHAVWFAIFSLFLILPVSSMAATPVQFSESYFTAKTSNLGMPIKLQARLTSSSGSPLSGKTIYFDIYYSGAWHEINPDDNGYATNSSGVAGEYYYVDPTLAAGFYPIRARFDGDGEYSSATLERTLTAAKANFTFALFLNGDNNLEDDAIADFYDELYPQGTNTNVNFIVLFDRVDAYDDTHDDWKDTRLFVVTPESVESDLYLYMDWGEQNMGDPETLANFAQTAFSDFPSENTVLVIWDHGSGWYDESKSLTLDQTASTFTGTHVKLPMPAQVAARLAAKKAAVSLDTTKEDGAIKSVSIDNTSGDRLSLPEVSCALESSGHIVDVLAMDACLMGMVEVAYEVKDVARHYVASAETISVTGYNYEDIGQNITAAMSPHGMASLLVDLFAEYYEGTTYDTLAAWDLENMDSLFAAMETFSTTLLDRMDRIPYTERSALRYAAQAMIDQSSHFDIGSLAYQAQQLISDDEVTAAAQNLEDKIQGDARVNYWVGGRAYADKAHMTGLSIYWPLTRYFDSDYMDTSVLAYANQSWNKTVRLLLDTTAPTTTKVDWITPPHAVDDSSIAMQSFTAVDKMSTSTGILYNTVYYQFTLTQSPTGGSGGSDSSNRYESTAYTDTGLEPNHQYCYTVYAHDGAGNETSATGEECAVTLAQVPGPGRLTNDVCGSIKVTWDPLSNPNGTEYYCENTTNGDFLDWTPDTSWRNSGLTLGSVYSFRVKARNSQGVETAWQDLGETENHCWGDVNRDNYVTLADAILCLQVAAGLEPENIDKTTAIDALRQIGLDEALYILQIEGEFR